MGEVGALLERAARATPATAEATVDGWWLRHTDSAAWWSGAVLAHGAGDRIEERVVAAERFADAHGGPARFQLCADCPPGLDAVLAARGYVRRCPVDLLTAAADAAVPPPAPPPGARLRGEELRGEELRVEERPGEDWLAVVRATSPQGEGVDPRLLARVPGPQAFLTLLADGTPVGVARVVDDAGWTGVFAMATVPAARRRGVARRVLAGAAAWARSRGTTRLYLQVETGNEPARRLYEAGGFTRLASYSYRVQADRG